MPFEMRYDSNAALQKQKYEELSNKLGELSNSIQKDAKYVDYITTLLNNGLTMETDVSGEYYDEYITAKKLFVAELVKLNTRVSTAQSALSNRIRTCNEKASDWAKKIYYQVWVEPVRDKNEIKRMEK